MTGEADLRAKAAERDARSWISRLYLALREPATGKRTRAATRRALALMAEAAANAARQ